MVLISIHPFALRKVFLVLAALLCFSAFCFADPVFMAEHYLPPSGPVGPVTHAWPGMPDQVDFAPGKPIDLPTREQRIAPAAQRTDEARNPEKFLEQPA